VLIILLLCYTRYDYKERGVIKMAEEEKKEETTESTETNDKPSFKTVDELTNFLLDLQGQIGNMQETIDKLTPVEETTETPEEKPEETPEEKTDDEINEIDRLLQSE